MKTQTAITRCAALAALVALSATAFAGVHVSENGGTLTVTVPTTHAGKSVKLLWGEGYAHTNTLCDAVSDAGGTYTFDLVKAGIENGTELHFYACTRYKVLDKLFQPAGTVINTGVKDSATYGVRVGVQPVQFSGFLLGAQGSPTFAIQVPSQSMLRIYINGAGNVTPYYTSGKMLDIAATNEVLTIDGVQVENDKITTSPVGQTGKFMTIGKLNGLKGNNGSGWWSYVQFYDENGELLLDYVPVEVCADGTIGFFDRASGVMVSGTFSTTLDGSDMEGTPTGEYIETGYEDLGQSVTVSRMLDVSANGGTFTVTVPSALAGERLVLAWDSQDRGDNLADWAHSATLADPATAGGIVGRFRSFGIKNGDAMRVFAANVYKTMDKLYQPTTAYVNTGFKDCETHGVRFGLQPSGTGFIFGSSNPSGKNNTFAVNIQTLVKLQFYITGNASSIDGLDTGRLLDIAVTNTVLTIDGETKLTGRTTSPVGIAGESTGRTMTIGRMNGFASSGSGYWSYVRLDDVDGVAMLDYIPVQRVIGGTDGTVGFYDRATLSFVAPTAGEFTAGTVSDEETVAVNASSAAFEVTDIPGLMIIIK